MNSELKEVEIMLLDSRFGQQLDYPSYSTDGAAGLDLIACIQEKVILHPQSEPLIIPTGIAIYIKNPEYAGMVIPKANLGHQGLVLSNSVGLLNSDSQSPLLISVKNNSETESIAIMPGEKFAQIVFFRVERPVFKQVDIFSGKTIRTTGLISNEY